MKTTARFATVGGIALATAALFAGPASATTPGHQHGAPVFIQTDNTTANTVVAYDSDSSGRLTQSGTYRTGGVGGVLTGSVVDHTASQGSLAYDKAAGLLYAVNAGSNTITVFAVHGDQLQRRQVISSDGTFPVSVAVHGHTVYVLNARDGGSVQGYVRVGQTLVRIPQWHRALGLDPTATPEFTHTPGQVAFTPDGRQLLVTTKGNTSAIDVFGVNFLGGLSAKPVVNVQPGAVPFGVTFDARGDLAVAQAGTNAVATFKVNRDGTLTVIDTALTGQAATCWIVAVGGNLFASNAGGATVSGYADRHGALTALGNTTTDPGTVDAAAASNGRTLYVQTGGNGIVDAFHITAAGSLTPIGSVTVPGGIGGEGIVAL
jgi:6-phosphogluconolactonase (cycloisomerase 2 family)